MSYESVFGPVMNHYKNVMIHQTFGHLFPDGLYYEGYLRIANSVYTQHGSIIDEQIGITNSPWWYDAAINFVHEVYDDMEAGEIADFYVAVTVETVLEDYPEYLEDDEIEDFERETHQCIHISTLKKIILVKPF